MEDLLKLIPGMANNPALKISKWMREKKLPANVPFRILYDTGWKRENPDLLSPSRRRRIANGSGNSFVWCQ